MFLYYWIGWDGRFWSSIVWYSCVNPFFNLLPYITHNHCYQRQIEFCVVIHCLVYRYSKKLKINTKYAHGKYHDFKHILKYFYYCFVRVCISVCVISCYVRKEELPPHCRQLNLFEYWVIGEKIDVSDISEITQNFCR